MKSILPRTIQGRLVLSHLLVSLVSIVLVTIYSAGALYRAVIIQAQSRYQALGIAAAQELASFYEQTPLEQMPASGVSSSIERFFSDQANIHFNVFHTDGSAVYDSSGAVPQPASPTSDPEVWEAIANGSRENSRIRRDEAGEMRVYKAFLIEDDNRVYGVLRLDFLLAVVVNQATNALALLVAAALLVALGMGAVGYFLAHSLAGPIENITRAAESLTMGELRARVEAPAVPHEIYRLSQAFNLMASRIQALVGELRSFVANASHELRTPLTSIKLRVEALRSGALDDRPVTEKFLEEIESEVDRLSNMVTDLLDLSRIEAGLDAGTRVPVELGAMIAEAHETFSVRAERAGVSLSYQVEPGLPAVMGSEDQLRRVIYNLVDNAIKYTQPGGLITITLQHSQAANSLRMTVTDTGYGIAPAQIPHVFDRFYRVEATRPRYGRSQGSGLGLPIAKSIVESLGGKIGVSSEVGQGSCFWVELPLSDKK